MTAWREEGRENLRHMTAWSCNQAFSVVSETFRSHHYEKKVEPTVFCHLMQEI